MGTYYLIRHGQTEDNLTDTMTGQQDVPLTPLGLRQAALTGEALADSTFSAVFSSDLIRAKVTAEEILRHQDCPLVLDKRLRDLAGGVFEGKPLSVMRQWSSRQENSYTAVRPGGESTDMMRARVTQAFFDIHASYPSVAVAIVTHMAAIRMILNAVTGQNPQLYRGRYDNCSISVFRGSTDSGFTIVKENDTSHL